jgi:hypothetical protein
MKINLSLLMLLVGATTILSCKNSGDNFVGKWTDCERPDPNYGFTITQEDGKYIVHDIRADAKIEVKKISNDILEERNELYSTRLTYDKSTNHIIVSVGKGTKEASIFVKDEKVPDVIFCNQSAKIKESDAKVKNNEFRGPDKFIGKWLCSACPYKILTIQKYGDNFTIDMDGGGVFNASYNKEFDKLVCDQLNEPNIIYNSQTDKIRAIGSEYTRMEGTKK